MKGVSGLALAMAALNSTPQLRVETDKARMFERATDQIVQDLQVSTPQVQAFLTAKMQEGYTLGGAVSRAYTELKNVNKATPNRETFGQRRTPPAAPSVGQSDKVRTARKAKRDARRKQR